MNHLLADMHGEVIESLVETHRNSEVIVDKFAKSSLMRDRLHLPPSARLRQETGAERFTVVACASILARAQVLRWMFTAQEKYLV